ncbi:MAG: methyltetrahydrofolate cobalamin methyltransferase, partial [Pseudomonadota bacterium]
AGMTSAIMNPVALPTGPTKIAEKRAEVAAAGVMLPEGMDDETFVQLFGLGSTLPRAGKEMEAIRAANFLTNNDDGGGEWIKFNRVPAAPGTEARGRGGRAGGRRRRA